MAQVKKQKDAELCRMDPGSEKQQDEESKARLGAKVRDLEEELRLVKAEKVGFFLFSRMS